MNKQSSDTVMKSNWYCTINTAAIEPITPTMEPTDKSM